MTLVFATATPAQNAVVHHILQQAFAGYVGRLRDDATPGPYPWLDAAIERSDVYVALEDGAVVGVLATSHKGDDLMLGFLGVDPANQGKGIGGWLLEQIAVQARNTGIRTLRLHTAVIMTDLLRLYRRHGFVETHRAPPDHDDDAHLRVHMMKSL